MEGYLFFQSMLYNIYGILLSVLGINASNCSILCGSLLHGYGDRTKQNKNTWEKQMSTWNQPNNNQLYVYVSSTIIIGEKNIQFQFPSGFLLFQTNGYRLNVCHNANCQQAYKPEAKSLHITNMWKRNNQKCVQLYSNNKLVEIDMFSYERTFDLAVESCYFVCRCSGHSMSSNRIRENGLIGRISLYLYFPSSHLFIFEQHSSHAVFRRFFLCVIHFGNCVFVPFCCCLLVSCLLHCSFPLLIVTQFGLDNVQYQSRYFFISSSYISHARYRCWIPMEKTYDQKKIIWK